MRIGSLFSGYGGLDMAVEEVFGATTAWHVEFDKAPSKILAHHWPDVPNLGDVTAVDWSSVEPVDIITGGSPCQDLSHAGKRQGMTEGTRSNLWVAMREAIAQLRPSYVVWENVRGAASAPATSEVELCSGCMGASRLDSGPVLRALGRVVGDLSDLGYVGRVRGIRAADIGAPHGRFRFFLTAWLAADASRLRRGTWRPSVASEATRGWTSADLAGRDLFPTPRATDGTKGGPNQRGSSGDLMLPSAVALLGTPTARDGKGSGHGDRLAESLRRGQVEAQVLSLLPTPAVNDMGAAYTPEMWDEWTAKMKAAHGNGNGHGPSLNVEAQRLATDEHGDACCTAYGQSWITSEGVDYGPAVRRWHDLTRCTPAPAELGGKGGRRLAAEFSEWMMGLSAGHVTATPGLSRNDQLKALGNGVVPQQAKAAVRWALSASLEAVA